jgi:predicted aspartyl protease
MAVDPDPRLFRMTKRGFLGAAAALAFATPGLARAAGAKAAKPIVTPFALDEGRILIAAFVGKSGPLLFALDSGSPFNLIFAGAANELGLRVSSDARVSGIGGVSEYPWFTAGQVEIGGLRLTDVAFAGIGSRLSKSAVGAFGAGLLTTFDSELDFHASEWRLYPDGPADRTGFHKLPSRFLGVGRNASKLAVRATVGAFDGEFLLDTGAPGELVVSSRAATRTGLWDDRRPYAPTQVRGFARTAIPARFVRIPALRIGPFVFERPVVKLIQPGSPLNDLEADGLIGLGAIRRLNLSIDTHGEAVWAAPSGIDVPPSDYPLSGLWVAEAPGGLSVVDVGTGSPAAAAGVRKGDRIVGETLQPFLRRLDQSPGAAVSFELEQGGARRRVEITLSDFLQG